jgi:hypothetical protein
MKKKVATAVTLILGAFTTIMGYFVWALDILISSAYDSFSSIFFSALCSCLIIAVICGIIVLTVFAVRKVLLNRNLAYEFCLICYALAISIFVFDVIFTMSKWNTAVTIIANIGGIGSLIFYFVSCILLHNQKNYFLATFFAFIPFYILGIASSATTTLNNVPISYAVGFIILGLFSIILSLVGGILTRKNKPYGFELNVTAILFEVLQLIIFCAMATETISIVVMILCFCGVAAIAVGGILISQSVEFGFVITSFGIIALLVWIGLLMFSFSILISISAIAMIIAIILFMSNAVKMNNTLVKA